jgi:hypothetical protein
LANDEIARDYFRKAQAAAPVVRWLVDLHSIQPAAPAETSAPDGCVAALIERLESVLEHLGTVHDRKYDAEESRILNEILQSDDGVVFERGHEHLGNLLGYAAGNSTQEAAPDSWWIADDSLCFVFEDHAEGKSDTVFSVRKARQASTHPDWIKAELNLPAGVQIIPILITPCTRTTKGAVPHLKQVRYWSLDDFRAWAKNALQAIRELRRDFPGPGHLGWRMAAAEKLRTALIGPHQLMSLLSKNAADAMTDVNAENEDC